jgi:hypothetical protein
MARSRNIDLKQERIWKKSETIFNKWDNAAIVSDFMPPEIGEINREQLTGEYLTTQFTRILTPSRAIFGG